ncbi:hypothetical protein P20652_2763 [Pseudoalteromonas sp. BSi20652]|uniref:DUF2937 family protein n=1 Tax=Pseudoalteromonas sp. BSi20652 TaxID=388384 RepID=UPI000231BAB2|nr:DUF2937 family protein [Pseudoalteromonas sp. BSi20652]GAA60895.1 hypothetical protein P20652_2763 [Pseudoalteromonas sp. BSi20652]
MSKLLDYIRLSFFACGLLLGVQIPAFVSDFGQALNAHLVESDAAIAPFKKDAAQYFNNDLNKLIKHYQNLDDEIVGKGANHINTLYERQQSLQQAVNEFTQSPYLFTLSSEFTTIKQQVWHHFEGQIILKKDSITAAIITGILIAMLAELCGFLLLVAFRRSYKKLLGVNK